MAFDSFFSFFCKSQKVGRAHKSWFKGYLTMPQTVKLQMPQNYHNLQSKVYYAKMVSRIKAFSFPYLRERDLENCCEGNSPRGCRV